MPGHFRRRPLEAAAVSGGGGVPSGAAYGTNRREEPGVRTLAFLNMRATPVAPAPPGRGASLLCAQVVASGAVKDGGGDDGSGGGSSGDANQHHFNPKNLESRLSGLDGQACN